MTRGERVLAFIDRYLLAPEGQHVGKPLKLDEFQRNFILDVYDNPAGTARAYLSLARKNGKTVLIAALVLAHTVGPEAVQNSQIVSGARSRDQAALVFKAAEKMLNLSPELRRLARTVPSTKTIVGLAKNVEYRALAAEAGSNHGLSPIVAILDEVGQVKGPHDPFVEAIETSQGAYDNALLFAISTQAPTDADLFSIWLDAPEDPHTVKRLYTAPDDADLMDHAAWKAANPALGSFRSLPEMERAAEKAVNMPSSENSFRWLYLNQRISAEAPFVSRSVWEACAAPIAPYRDQVVYAGLDLSATTDLTSLVLAYKVGDVWQLKPFFWLPSDGLAEKAKADRIPYLDWKRDGYLEVTPGPTIQYEFVAHRLAQIAKECDLRRIAFDRWNYKHLVPWLKAAGFTDAQVEGDHAIFSEFGQGYKDFSPALRTFEENILNRKIAHGGNPPLTMCMANAVVEQDAAGGRKLAKNKSTGRIDGAVAATMAVATAATYDEKPKPSYKMFVLG